MIEILTSPQAWISLATLTGLEIILGIDNIIFIAILCSRLPREKQRVARLGGLALAMVTRILLFFSIFWVMKLTKPLFSVFGVEISGKDIILILGGLFLIAKSTIEIHSDVSGSHENSHKNEDQTPNLAKVNLLGTMIQISILDIIFSLDSVITAVGMAQHIEIMIAAVVIAVSVMMMASGAISAFVERNQTIKILALAFLILIGVNLIAEAIDLAIPKGYIYFAMAFSLAVELINILARKKAK